VNYWYAGFIAAFLIMLLVAMLKAGKEYDDAPSRRSYDCPGCGASIMSICPRDCPNRLNRHQNAPVCHDSLHHHCPLMPFCIVGLHPRHQEERAMSEPTAEVILSSVSPQGVRLTTMQVKFHRFVLAEFNTHRMFSRNFRSSRAVPVKKLIEEVRTAPVEPVRWQRNVAGMQGGEDMTPEEVNVARYVWRRGASLAADVAEELAQVNLHKQWANRGLETYLWVHGVVTSTEWDNFFGLRLDRFAQPEMQALARAMWNAYKSSTPTPLQPCEWHLPYVEKADRLEVEERMLPHINPHIDSLIEQTNKVLLKVSVARCARVSYRSFETGNRSTVEEDRKMYQERLFLPDVGGEPIGAAIHASPAEHQATPDGECHYMDFSRRKHVLVSSNRHEWGNLVGWRQYRKMLPGEAVAPLPEEFR